MADRRRQRGGQLGGAGATLVAQRRIGPALPPARQVPRRQPVPDAEHVDRHRAVVVAGRRRAGRGVMRTRRARPRGRRTSWVRSPCGDRAHVRVGPGGRRDRTRRAARRDGRRRLGAALVSATASAFAAVLPTCRIWVNGDAAEPTTPSGPLDEVAVLPPVREARRERRVGELSLDEIRERRRVLQELDDAVSYVRRVAQGRADLARAELARRRAGDAGELTTSCATSSATACSRRRTVRPGRPRTSATTPAAPTSTGCAPSGVSAASGS